MEEVATGGAGGSGEQLPMVLKVPHLIQHPLLNCFESYSMLGFGDILVPGLLVSYCHSYDLQRQGSGRWVYWMVANFFYLVGMITTFASLFLMNQAQPALLYLCPFTLIPVCIVAYFRGDLGYMWRGEQVVSFNGLWQYSQVPIKRVEWIFEKGLLVYVVNQETSRVEFLVYYMKIKSREEF